MTKQRIRLRLKKEEVEKLGLFWKGKDDKGQNPRYTVNKEDIDRIRNKGSKPKLEENFTFGTFTDTDTEGYHDNEDVKLNAWNHETGRVMTLEEYCDTYSININHVTSYKRVDYLGVPTYNVACHIDRDIKEVLDIDFLTTLVKEHIQKIELPELPKSDLYPITYADRLLFTDVHIGMDPDPEGISPFGFKWNEDEIMHRCNLMINWVLENKKGSILIIDNLGDFLDGQDGQTVRGGHDLPQNMTNRIAFSVGYRFYLALADAFAPHYDEVIFNNICNDNHSGDFAWYLSEKFRAVCNERYDNVKCNSVVRFFDHYEIFDHTKVISHGKDKKTAKYGMKIKPDGREITKIDQYLKHHKLYDGRRIEFSKGDNHQSLQDYTVQDFDYNNVPAFSPSSEYVQENYSKGRSGFQVQHLNSANKQVTYSPYWF